MYSLNERGIDKFFLEPKSSLMIFLAISEPIQGQYNFVFYLSFFVYISLSKG